MKTLTRSVVATFSITVFLTISGCATYHGQYSVLSNRVLDLHDFDPAKALAKRVYAEGSSERHIIATVADRNSLPTLDEAIDRALEEGEGDVILNAQVLRWGWHIPLIYGTWGWKVVGDVIDTGSGGAKLQSANPWAHMGLPLFRTPAF